ncbi:MAG: orotate phosphoribosyltransferase [Methanolinea sp.]|jgi:orotate phosphoribosyltransferase|nr:orotate phosphoribosyltransferase [Methanolinea sp.]
MVTRIAQLLDEYGAVEYGDFLLASGARSAYYLDIKKVLTRPGALREIGAAIACRYTFEVVAGVAVGGVPLAVAVSLASERPFAIIRSQEKGHGKSGRIVGDVQGKRVLLVEDVTTSGGSALFGVQALREAGATIDCVVTVVDREAGASALLLKEGVVLDALVKAADLIGDKERTAMVKSNGSDT